VRVPRRYARHRPPYGFTARTQHDVGLDLDRHADPGGLSDTEHVSAGLSRMVDRMALGQHRSGRLPTAVVEAVDGHHHLRADARDEPTDGVCPHSLLDWEQQSSLTPIVISTTDGCRRSGRRLRRGRGPVGPDAIAAYTYSRCGETRVSHELAGDPLLAKPAHLVLAETLQAIRSERKSAAGSGWLPLLERFGSSR
jgi:hypothetical protein